MKECFHSTQVFAGACTCFIAIHHKPFPVSQIQFIDLHFSTVTELVQYCTHKCITGAGGING